MDGQVLWSDLGFSFGRTSPEHSPATREETSRRSSRRSQGSQSRKLPMCLCLTRASGQRPDASTMTWADGPLLGEYMTRSFGESPSEENASRLSQILEDSPDPKFFLSAKACLGILTRANRRGKKLPPELEAALIAPTITGDHQNRVTDYTAVCVGNGQLNQITMSEQCNTLDTMHDQQAVFIPPVAHALRAKANCDFREDSETYVCRQTVRRLTPLECERLQGYPDGWTDIGDWTDSKGKKHREADSPRYKALGNSIALPFWFWLLRRISAQYERPATLGSLFDGIGGFPLCWERCNGKGTALWASEIEEFPIAVTKKHFPE